MKIIYKVCTSSTSVYYHDWLKHKKDVERCVNNNLQFPEEFDKEYEFEDFEIAQNEYKIIRSSISSNYEAYTRNIIFKACGLYKLTLDEDNEISNIELHEYFVAKYED